MSYADDYVFLGCTLAAAGRSLEEALELIKRGLRLNPRYPAFHANFLGLVYIGLGRYEEAIAALQQALSRNPNLLFAHFNLAVAYSELGREAEARAEAATVLQLNPNFSLEVARQIFAIKDPAVLERYLAAARKAGLK